ncbi:MAG TPA: potassium transporter KtrB [Candidatus Scybalocola faecipullorum]|nr:potassium transporter KtrB [Candidatus Scybalocola faecipullorum]
MAQEDESALKKRWKFSTTQIIAFGFLLMIFIGAVLLTLPISSADGSFTPFVDALFTSTTASCVTGLVTVNTLQHWNLFGHIIILLLIQFGGWGVITFTTIFLMMLGKRITLRQRMLIQDAYNLNTLKGLVKLTIKIIKGTVIIEGAGALLYMIKFIPEYGILQGAWKSLFTSVSAFCNAGIDIIGTESLAPYRGSFIVNFTTIALIVIGGIGFFVWWDFIAAVKKKEGMRRTPLNIFRRLSLHSKIVITTTAILIFGGTLFILIADFNNPLSLGELPLHEKIYASFFQAVTVRTAGYQTMLQENFSNATQMMSMLLMFVGGSPGGTAGGVKTATVAMIYISVVSMLKGKKCTEVFNRKIANDVVLKGLSVIVISLSVLLISTIALSIVMEDSSMMDIAYETTSAIATVGLSRSFTPSLNTIGKVIIIATMYIGRVGPISMALAFNVYGRRKAKNIQLPEEKIMVG